MNNKARILLAAILVIAFFTGCAKAATPENVQSVPTQQEEQADA